MDMKKGGEIIGKNEVVEQINNEDMTCSNCGHSEFIKKKSTFHGEAVTATVVSLPICVNCGLEYEKSMKTIKK